MTCLFVICFKEFMDNNQLAETPQVLDRGEKIELLVDKTENLRSQVSMKVAYCISTYLSQKTLV